MNDHTLFNEGIEFMRRNYSQHAANRFGLVNDCAQHLKTIADISNASAERISAKSLGEYERHLHDSYIDIDASTSQTIFLKSPAAGVSYAFTAATLMKLMRVHAIPIP